MLKTVLMFVKAFILLGYVWYKFESKNDFDISSGLRFDFQVLSILI